MTRLSVVIPVRNETSVLNDLFAELLGFCELLKHRGYEVELIVCDNGSTDSSWSQICESLVNFPLGRAYRFNRNYGYQASLKFGFSVASGQCLVVYQADQQDPLSLVPEMLSLWESGSRVVAGRVVRRTENWADRAARGVFYKVFGFVSNLSDSEGIQDFYLLDRSVYEELALNGYAHQFIRGQIANDFGFSAVIPYEREGRKSGRSSFSFSQKYDLAMDGLLLFGGRLVRRITFAAIALAISSGLALIGLTIAVVVGWRPGLAGWASLVLIQLLILGGSAFFFAVSCEYLIRLYDTQLRPNVPIIRSRYAPD